MKKSIFKKGTSALLAVVMCLSAFLGIGSTTAFAAEATTDEVVMFSFPREGDDNFGGDWGHGELHYMNGWSAASTKKITVYTIGSWSGNACYCIEPGTPLDIGDVMTKRDETYWDNYPSTYNKTISADEIKLFIGRIFQYGYTGTVDIDWRSQNSADADKMAHIMATQTLIWETVVGERDGNFNHVDTGNYDAVNDRVSKNHPLYSQYTIYRSMQKQGLMSRGERTQSYTINVLLSVFLLLFANFVRVATKETTEALYVISQVVVIAIYIGILVSWAASVYDRIVSKTIRRYLITLVGLMMLWMLMRTLRHTVFLHVFPMGQWCWYAYYISMILIPQVSLMAAKCIGKPEECRPPKSWYLMYIPSIAMIVGILTNDLHQWAFRFHLGYEAGWDIYQHNILYYIATAWIFACIAMMIAEVIRHCRIPGSKKTIWFPIGLLGIAVAYTVLYAVDSNLFGFIEMTAALCFVVVAIWESCIKTGLIQSNSHYDELLKCSGLGVTVVDKDFAVHYRSDDAIDLPREQMQTATATPVMLDGGIRVSGSKIKGGYTIYQEDISELLDILDELKELREELQDSNAVSMKNYQIDKRIRALAEKNRLHDELHRQTAKQINLLNDWLTRLSETEDADEKRELLRRIVVVGAYLKRRNNLVLVSEQDGLIKEEELNLSIKEMMKNLQIAGVSCAASVQFEKDIPSDVVMQLFDFYEYVVENAFDGLTYLLARFFSRDNSFYCCVDAVCSLDLTALATDTVLVSVTDENYYTLSFKAEGGDGK